MNDVTIYSNDEDHARKILAEHRCQNIDQAIRELRVAGLTKFRPSGIGRNEVVVRAVR